MTDDRAYRLSEGWRAHHFHLGASVILAGGCARTARLLMGWLPIALLLVSVGASPVARAQPPPADAAAAAGEMGVSTPVLQQPESTDPSQSPLPDLGKGAEEVAALLRHLTESLSDSAAFSALEADVAAGAHRAAERWIETAPLLKGNLRPTALDSLASSWDALRSELDDLSDRVDLRARRRDADLETLTKLHASWTRAFDLARKADDPASVLERVQSTLEDIDATRPAIEQRRARVLVLQDSVSRSLETCDDALARIDDSRREAVERAFARQLPPVWQSALPPVDGRSSERPLAAGLGAKVDSLRIYARTYWVGLVLSGLLVLVLMVLLRRGRFAMEGRAERDGAFVSGASAFRTPYAAAILLGLLLSRPLRPYPPFAVQQMTLAIVTAAAIFVLYPILQAREALAVYALAALFLLNLASELLEIPPGLEQVILIIEMGATTALLLWASAQLGEPREIGSGAPRLRAVGRAFVRIIALGCGASAAAAALGYLDLAHFLGVGLLYLLFLAFGLLALRVVLDGLVTIGLATGPLARLNAVARHRALIERRTRSALDVALVALWIWIALGRFELLEPAGALLRGVLDARLRVGELDLPLARVLGFAAVVIGIYVSTRVVVMLLEEDVYSRMTLPRGVPYALSTLTRYGLLLAGFLLALGTLGLDLTRITVLVSALGLGIGFGLQQIMNNLVSGLILLFERPVQVGDTIELGDLAGDVLRIGIRSSTLRTPQGAEVVVPNSKMIEEKVTNWTLSDRRRRIDLDIGVKGDTDAERIITLLGDVARRDPRVSSHPGPEAVLVRFGEDSSDFQLHVWTDDPQGMRLRSDLAVALQRALRAARTQDTVSSQAKKTGS